MSFHESLQLASKHRRSIVANMSKAPGLEALYLLTPAEEVRGPSGRLYTGSSLCCLKPATWPRRWAIRFVESKPFDPFILVTIICNCATMAWESPLDPCCTPKADFIDVRPSLPARLSPFACWPMSSHPAGGRCVSEWIYLYIFTVEMFSKILAYGFLFNREAYLKDAWCVAVGGPWCTAV